MVGSTRCPRWTTVAKSRGLRKGASCAWPRSEGADVPALRREAPGAGPRYAAPGARCTGVVRTACERGAGPQHYGGRYRGLFLIYESTSMTAPPMGAVELPGRHAGY